MNHVLVDHFRCPDDFANFELLGSPLRDPGFFRFGPEAICYGRTGVGFTAADVRTKLYDVSADVRVERGKCLMPFDPTAVVENMRRERYIPRGSANPGNLAHNGFVRKAYYLVRPFLPVALRKHLQRISLKGWDQKLFPSWPIDRTCDQILERLMLLALKSREMDKVPFIWFWPEGKSGCVVMTHDVETRAGLDFCSSLMDLNDSFGIKSSFQIIPGGRYHASEAILEEIRNRGFEINLHDWNHDGSLYSNRETFLSRAEKINQAAKELGAKGFRSGVLYRNLDWYDSLAFSYDMSVPNVGHLDPQPGGCCTVMPYFIGHILELPLTTTQDYSLFSVLGTYSIELWKRQIHIIKARHGLISFVVHPDYVIERRAQKTYTALLDYLSSLKSTANLWMALPGQVDSWWRARNQMRLVQEGNEWRIRGPGAERAKVAYAMLDGDDLVYQVGDRPAEGADHLTTTPPQLLTKR